MIDAILMAVIVGAFLLGFKAGNKFASFGELLQAGVDAVKSSK